MKHRLQYPMRWLICLLIGGVLMSSCSKDDDLELPPASTLKGYSYHDFHKLHKSKTLQDQVQKMQSRNAIMAKSGTEDHTFVIDTSIVQILEAEQYVSYTFKADRNPVDENYLDNYVLTIYNDDSFHQMYVSYPILVDEETVTYDIDNAIATQITGEALVQKNTCGASQIPVTSWSEDCVDYECGSGQHSGSSQTDSCSLDELGTQYGPTTICVGGWVTNCLDAGDSSSGGDGSGQTGTGGTGGSGTPTDPTDPDLTDDNIGQIGVIPFIPPTQETDPNAKSLLEQSNLPKVKALINRLRDKVKDSLNQFKEDGASFEITVTNVNGQRTLSETEVPPKSTDKESVELDINRKTDIATHYHTRFWKDRIVDSTSPTGFKETTGRTVAIFSAQDMASFILLHKIRERENIGKPEAVENDNISYILVTSPAKDTDGNLDSGVYALKISDPERVKELKDAFDTEDEIIDLLLDHNDIVNRPCKSGNNTCRLNNFIDFLKNHKIDGYNGKGFGIDVYVMVEGEFNTIKEWKKL
ncbi:hypothetical protein [Aquimarina sp. 2201CG14-23]|uniref:hypothetical protein n=1 Tax=Aquimarina mycalae TaxID=3040073 RepID=UPI00247810F8|nr:hypothetical protein [Aquimarina sp. 2201CG14-23]MDH7446341.1 hypothetical protein [Aquimarina sp. 2201CG14-23]